MSQEELRLLRAGLIGGTGEPEPAQRLVRAGGNLLSGEGLETRIVWLESLVVEN